MGVRPVARAGLAAVELQAVTVPHQLRRSWAGLPAGADVWICQTCQRDFKSREEAEECERYPLPELPLPPGVRILYSHHGETRSATIAKTNFAFNGSRQADGAGEGDR